jgi:phosphoglycerate dehydrogenase-like enzyme
VGLGAITQAIADRLDPSNVTTTGVRHKPEKGRPADEVFGYDHLHDALAGAEYIAIACPLTEATEVLLGQQKFETISPDAVVVNIARGSVIDTEALVSVLATGHLRGGDG